MNQVLKLLKEYLKDVKDSIKRHKTALPDALKRVEQVKARARYLAERKQQLENAIIILEASTHT